MAPIIEDSGPISVEQVPGATDSPDGNGSQQPRKPRNPRVLVGEFCRWVGIQVDQVLRSVNHRLNQKIVLRGEDREEGQSRIGLESMSDEERSNTFTAKILKSIPFVVLDSLATVLAVTSGVLPHLLPEYFKGLANPTTALRIRTALDAWFVMSGVMDARANGTKGVFSRNTGFTTDTWLNFGIPLLLATDLSHADNMGVLIGDDVSEIPDPGTDATDSYDSDGGEEVRATRLAGQAGRVGRVARMARLAKVARVGAALSRIRKRYGDVVKAGVEEVHSKQAISEILILFSVAIMGVVGAGFHDPKDIHEAKENLEMIGMFLATLLGAEWMLKRRLDAEVFAPLNNVVAELLKRGDGEPRVRRILEEFLRQDKGYKKFELIGAQALELARVIATTPDLLEKYLFGELEPGLHKLTMVTTDLIDCSNAMSRDPDGTAEVLDDYFPRLISGIKRVDHAGDASHEGAATSDDEPESACEMVKTIGDAAFLYKKAGTHEAEIVTNVISTILNTQGVLKGTRAAIHTGDVNIRVMRGDHRMRIPDILGHQANALFRIIDLNKAYGTAVIVTGSTYALLPPALQAQLFFVDRVTPQGSQEGIDIYCAPLLPTATNGHNGGEAGTPTATPAHAPTTTGVNIEKIPDRLIPTIKGKTELFKAEYVAGNFADATRILQEIKDDTTLHVFMPWIDNVLGFMERRGVQTEGWDQCGRRYSSKSGAE